MRFTISIIFTLLIAFVSCKSENKSGQDAGAMDEVQVVDEKKVTYTEADLGNLYQHYHSDPSNQKEIDENKIIEYAAANNLHPNRSLSGLYYAIDKQGSGATLNVQDQIFAHYRGKTIDGKEFDSSYERGKPISFKIGEMIPGWNEAMIYLRKGDKATLLVPSHQAYGLQGMAGYIGPNETLVFEIEIIDKK